jgi:xanthine dehydrogenase YagS FAD-binding subunit
MQAFAYSNPTTLQEAVSQLGTKWGEADILAGGTDLLSLMKEYLHTPQRVVNIKNIKELEGISKTADGLRIGALVTLDELARNAEVKAGYKAIADAAAAVDSPQIRHMGTAGGDLCQRPRCWYFRQGFGLLAMKNGKSLIPDGENKYHAIFGDGPAYFVSASSLGPALIALNAKVKLVSAKGPREVPLSKWFLAPPNETSREIALQPNEILTEIIVPATTPTMRTSTYELRQKEALDWPLVTASVALEMNGNAVKTARIVMGHVGPAPIESAAAGRALAGRTVSAANAEAAGKAAVAGAKPLSQNSYKVTLARVAVKRALLDAVKVAKA